MAYFPGFNLIGCQIFPQDHIESLHNNVKYFKSPFIIYLCKLIYYNYSK